MSIHLLIVDDEQITRDGLREMIPWGKYGIDRISATSNGKRALEIAKREPPDILLTDIRMPKMDGIELTRQIREFSPACRVLFISAYSDKDYLKSAIDLKVEQYIEKPINLEQVEQMAGALARQIRSHRMYKENEDALLHGLIATEPLVGQQIARALIDPESDLEALYQNYGKVYFTWQEKDWYTPVCLQPMCAQPEKRRELLVRTEQFLDHYTKLPVVSYYAGIQQGGGIILLFHRPRRRDLAQTLLPDLSEAIRGQGSGFSLGLGPECTALTQLPAAWLQAAATAENSFYVGAGSVLTQPPQGGELCGEEAEKLLTRALQSDDPVQAAESLCDLLADRQYSNVQQIKGYLYKLCWRLFREGGAETEPVARDAFFCLTLPEVRELLRQGAAGKKVLQEVKAEDPRVLRTVHCVLRRFPERELSIRTVAEEVGLSQNYLCTLFRQQTGKTLNDFILHVRLENAKDMLCHTQLRLYEISERVGIADPNYLSFVFKRETGVTPSAYRAEWNKKRGAAGSLRQKDAW